MWHGAHAEPEAARGRSASRYGSFGIFFFISSPAAPGATADRVVTWNLLLQRVWARTIFAGATRLFSMQAEVTGEEAVRRGPLFLFSRHASTLDTLLPAVFVTHPYTLRLGHVMKRELLWDPCLDIVGQRTRNAFGRVEWLDAEWARVEAWTAYAGSRPAEAA